MPLSESPAQKNTKGILVTINPDFLDRMDGYWKSEGYSSRSAFFIHLARKDMERERNEK